MQEIFILLLSFNPELALTRLSIDQPGPDYNELKWLNQVFRRLSGPRYDCQPNFITNRACKHDSSNPQKKRKPLQHLKGIKSLRET